jgi:hypothetical protein
MGIRVSEAASILLDDLDPDDQVVIVLGEPPREPAGTKHPAARAARTALVLHQQPK